MPPEMRRGALESTVPDTIEGEAPASVASSIGAYTVAGRPFDLWLALGFGVAGYVFKKLDYPIAPLVLAMVLGDKAEDAFRQSMIMSRGSLSIFWANGLVATLMLIGLALALAPLLSTVFGRLVKPKASSAVA